MHQDPCSRSCCSLIGYGPSFLAMFQFHFYKALLQFLWQRMKARFEIFSGIFQHSWDMSIRGDMVAQCGCNLGPPSLFQGWQSCQVEVAGPPRIAVCQLLLTGQVRSDRQSHESESVSQCQSALTYQKLVKLFLEPGNLILSVLLMTSRPTQWLDLDNFQTQYGKQNRYIAETIIIYIYICMYVCMYVCMAN